MAFNLEFSIKILARTLRIFRRQYSTHNLQGPLLMHEVVPFFGTRIGHFFGSTNFLKALQLFIYIYHIQKAYESYTPKKEKTWLGGCHNWSELATDNFPQGQVWSITSDVDKEGRVSSVPYDLCDISCLSLVISVRHLSLCDLPFLSFVSSLICFWEVFSPKHPYPFLVRVFCCL